MQSDVNMRRAARQKKIRQRRLLITSFFLLIIALITLIIMCFTVFFPVKEIVVEGSEIYSNEQIAEASQIKSKNLFTISKKKVEINIRKALPYVDSIEIKRKLPDKVVITVTDAKDFAYYKSDESYFVISEKGYVLKQQAEPPTDIFEIITDGMSGNLGEVVAYKNADEQELVDELISNLRDNDIIINKIDVTNTLQIRLTVEGKYNVELGTDENIEEKIKMLSTMIDDPEEGCYTIVLDMWTPENRIGSFRK